MKRTNALANQYSDRLIAGKVASIVLAGGQGTRLFPLTLSRCKPAVSFGGRYRLIDIPLSSSLNTQIKDIFVIAQYCASSLNQHIYETYNLTDFNASKIQLISPEESQHRKVWFKGTADAIRQNLEYFEKAPVDYFLILSGDQLYNMRFFEMLEFAVKEQADMVIASLPVEEPEARRMGLLKVSHSDHIIDFIEKPSDPAVLKNYQLSDSFYSSHKIAPKGKPHFLGSMGIYVFKRDALFDLLKKEGDDFGKDLIPQQVKKGKTAAFVYDGYWEDIGTVASYYKANLALTQRKNCLNTYDDIAPIFTRACNLPSPLIMNTQIIKSIISPGSIIECNEISNSIIGIRSKIKKGTVIKDSILLGNHFYEPPLHQSPPLPQSFSIGENCVIEKAIIDENASFGKDVHLINKNRLQKHDGDGVYIRDGIIIVTSGTRLSDGFVL